MTTRQSAVYDVIVVGAGAAGVGVGVVLKHLGVKRFTLIDRLGVGASFERWPEEMRFISPSFPSNGFGLMDLNAVAISTSPAYTLGSEHPNGKEYAAYLRTVAQHFDLPVQTGIDVRNLRKEGRYFHLETSTGELRSRFVIWAAGEFQYPRTELFPGAELCRHNATVDSWQTVNGDDFVIVGGYESGIDAAVNLVELGKRVRVLDDFAPWAANGTDPSLTLSPYTQQRLHKALATGRLELIEAGVDRVEKNGADYVVFGNADATWHTPVAPILATGFRGSLSLISHLFEWHPQAYYTLLTQDDESAKTRGLFLCGPMVRHGALIFCFIYKYRQRFAVVARAIGQRLGLDVSVLETYRKQQMLLDDLSCCDDSACVC